MPEQILGLRGVTKDFRGEFRIDSIDLDLFKGEVHVLVGENGSGKSVLMKIISGIFQKDAGEITYRGKPVAFKSLSEAMQAGIAYQHQELTLFENLSVAENLFFNSSPKISPLFCSYDMLKEEERCSRLLEEFGIAMDPTARVKTLGFTQRHLLSALKVYVSNAKVIIFDEPTASMNDAERDIFFTIISRLKKRVEGIFYISHRLDEIQRIGDRVSIMHQGSLLHTGVDPAMSTTVLFQMMTGDINQKRYPRITVPLGKEVLRVDNLSYDYALKDVSFALHKQEIVGITGLMGSGRTILAHSLFGLLQPTGGSIRINGKKVHFGHPWDALMKGIALIPENRLKNAMFPDHDLVQNMTIASLRRFQKASVIHAKLLLQIVRDYVNRLGINPGNDDDIMGTYSGGNQQKVMLARWFMRRSAIYIMDEPTRGVDVGSRIDLYNSMNDLISKGASVILISSDIEEILGMSDRILVLAGGRIVCDIPKAEATKQLILSHAY